MKNQKIASPLHAASIRLTIIINTIIFGVFVVSAGERRILMKLASMAAVSCLCVLALCSCAPKELMLDLGNGATWLALRNYTVLTILGLALVLLGLGLVLLEMRRGAAPAAPAVDNGPAEA